MKSSERFLTLLALSTVMCGVVLYIFRKTTLTYVRMRMTDSNAAHVFHTEDCVPPNKTYHSNEETMKLNQKEENTNVSWKGSFYCKYSYYSQSEALHKANRELNLILPQPKIADVSLEHVEDKQQTACGPLSYISPPGPITALASFPGSGNTWVRHLLQQATGETAEGS